MRPSSSCLPAKDASAAAGRDPCGCPQPCLDLRLDVVEFEHSDGLNLKGDRLAWSRLDEDLHATTEAEHKVDSFWSCSPRLLLDVVVRLEGAACAFRILLKMPLMLWAYRILKQHMRLMPYTTRTVWSDDLNKVTSV